MSDQGEKSRTLQAGRTDQRSFDTGRAWNLVSTVAPHRGLIQLAADWFAWVVGVYAAVALRFDFDLDEWSHGRIAVAIAIAIALQTSLGPLRGMYRRRERFGGFEEMASLASVVVVTTAVLYVVNQVVVTQKLVPASVAIGGGILALTVMSGIRFCWRLWIDRLRRPSADVATKVIVFGAGEAGHQLVTAMMRNPDSPLYPVALLDDDPVKDRYRIRGVVVHGGREHLAEVAERFDAQKLIIAVPSGTAELYRDLSARAIDAGLDVGVLPSVEELLDGQLGVGDVRPIDVKDLLGRKEIETDIDQVAGYITDRTVLVTGAGGSIGSELCRQIHRLAPARLVMLDRDESALHGLQLSLEGRALLSEPNLVVADIRDRERIDEIFRQWRPQVVFHAAALKHLPLLELHPEEGFKTNVQGTLNLLEAAADHGVERFVNISTDKAADPTSVLGITKRVAERLTAYVAQHTDGTYLSVRFGNVLGSRGSVLETFRAQVAAGGPVTVVDPEITRFFMTVEEAVQLVIQAGAIGDDGEALVLDMGTPVKIADVARQMIAHADRPIKIEYTGLRPGEKLHEVLMAPGEIGVVKSHPMITHVPVEPLEPSEARASSTLV